MDKNELVVKCDPYGYAIKKGLILTSAFTIEDIQLEVRKNSGGMEARVLSSKHRYGIWLPDGPYVPVRRDGDRVKIFDAVMDSCNSDIRPLSMDGQVRFKAGGCKCAGGDNRSARNYRESCKLLVILPLRL